MRDVRWHHRASLWQPGSSNPDDVRIGQQRKPHAMSAGIGPASGSLDGEKDKQKMTESSSSEQPRVTQSAAESGGATPQDHTGSRHVSFEIGPLDEKIEEFVGGDHAPSIVPAAVEASSSEPSRVTQAADGSGGATSQGQEQEFLNAALNEREEAHQAFRQWLAAKDLETTHWILGELGIRTVSSLVHLTEKQFEDTLELFPPKRLGEPGDVKDLSLIHI